MRKLGTKILVSLFCFFSVKKSTAQNIQTLLDVNNFISDAIWYSDKFITPATDGAIYQASSGWVTTPQQKKLWSFGVSLHTNVFFVPKANRSFTVSNSDFSFFSIENGSQSVKVPTAIGNDEQYYLVGSIDDGENQNEIRIKTPEGIDSETVIYPYIQASLGLWHGTEIIGKYSYNVKLKKGRYQVYGAGIKHNLDQYVKYLKTKKINLSVFAGYSNEDISFDFLTSENDQYSLLGLNQIQGLVDTWQFQINASKKWNQFELMVGAITNVSDIKYEVIGDNGTASFLIPVQSFVNNRLEEIYKTKINSIGEISGRYQFGHFYAQAAFAFGKFANTNISLQYEL